MFARCGPRRNKRASGGARRLSSGCVLKFVLAKRVLDDDTSGAGCRALEHLVVAVSAIIGSTAGVVRLAAFVLTEQGWRREVTHEDVVEVVPLSHLLAAAPPRSAVVATCADPEPVP